MMQTNETAAAVRAWAKGIYPLEAGAELLIRQGRAIYAGAPWLEDRGDVVAVDADRLLDGAGAWSGGEQRLVRIAASLLGGRPVDLNDDVAGLDREAMSLVLAALAHANGSHEHTALRVNDAGDPTGFERVPTLYPWPTP